MGHCLGREDPAHGLIRWHAMFIIGGPWIGSDAAANEITAIRRLREASSPHSVKVLNRGPGGERVAHRKLKFMYMLVHNHVLEDDDW